MRQHNHKTVYTAVSAMLELETYLRPTTLMTAAVTGSVPIDVDDVIAGVSKHGYPENAQKSSRPLQQVLERLEKIESQLQCKDSRGS